MRVLTIPVSDITQYPILSPYFIPVVVGKNMIWLCIKLGYPNIWCLIMILLHPYDNGRNWGPAISHGYPNWHPLGRCFIVRIFLLESPGNWPWKENGDSWRAKNRRVDVCRPELGTSEKSLGNIFIDIYIYNCLVGGFNHLEKYESQWERLSHIMENKKCSKPPTSIYIL